MIQLFRLSFQYSTSLKFYDLWSFHRKVQSHAIDHIHFRICLFIQNVWRLPWLYEATSVFVMFLIHYRCVILVGFIPSFGSLAPPTPNKTNQSQFPSPSQPSHYSVCHSCALSPLSLFLVPFQNAMILSPQIVLLPLRGHWSLLFTSPHTTRSCPWYHFQQLFYSDY